MICCADERRRTAVNRRKNAGAINAEILKHRGCIMSTTSNPFTTNLSRPLRQYDNGFFGPGSPSWKVWTSPTAAIGFQRAVVLEHFDPFLTAGAADQAGIYKDPQGRLDRTFAYFLLVALADSRTVIEASEFLMKIHARVDQESRYRSSK